MLERQAIQSRAFWRKGSPSRVSPKPEVYRLKHVPTTFGEIQQKNRQLIFSGVETSMKMTFHLPDENQRAARRRRASLSKTPPLFFHYENAFRKKRTDKPRQTQSPLLQ
jgi:hypothetical protein